MALKKNARRVLPKGAHRKTAATQNSTVPAPATNRLLTLSQAADLIDKTVKLSTLPTHSRETSKKDQQVLKKYATVTGNTKVRRKGIVLFLRAVLERQKHLKENFQQIIASPEKVKGYRNGKPRLMTLNSFRYSYVSVLRRLYKAQKPNKLAWSGRTAQDVKKLDTLAKSFLASSIETPAVDVEATTILIAALGQGGRHFFSHASLMCALLETARRVGCFKNRTFRHITMVKNITQPSKHGDPRACLIEVVFKRCDDKGEGEGGRGARYSPARVAVLEWFHRFNLLHEQKMC
jgi:hypothetical protein